MPVFLYGPTQLTLCHGTLLAEKFPQGAACRRPTSVLYPDAGAYPEDRLGTTGATSEHAPSRLRARTGAVAAETGTSRLRVRTVPRGGVSEGRWWRRGCGVLGSDGHARSSPLRVFEQFGRRKIFTTADATILHDFGTRWNSSRNDFDRYSKGIRMHIRGKKRLKKLIRFWTCDLSVFQKKKKVL